MLGFALALAGCPGDTVLGFAIGDISGLWTAESYTYAPVSGSAAAVDLIARDGARMTLAVDNSQAPPIVSTSFNDGAGNETIGGGIVNAQSGTLTIGDDLFFVDHDNDTITLTNDEMTFDFGAGPVPATLTIVLNRI